MTKAVIRGTHVSPGHGDGQDTGKTSWVAGMGRFHGCRAWGRACQRDCNWPLRSARRFRNNHLSRSPTHETLGWRIELLGDDISLAWRGYGSTWRLTSERNVRVYWLFGFSLVRSMAERVLTAENDNSGRNCATVYQQEPSSTGRIRIHDALRQPSAKTDWTGGHGHHNHTPELNFL